MAGRSLGHKLPGSTQDELDLRVADQGPDRDFLLLPLDKLPEGSWGLSADPSQQPEHDSRTF